jgi:hypothetical protein
MAHIKAFSIISLIMATNLFQASASGGPTKRDIRGVSTGMTIEEATRAIESAGGTCEGNRYNTNIDCQYPDGARISLPNREAATDRVWRITYFSPSPLGPEAYSYIIETYHLKAAYKDDPIDYVLPSGEQLQFNSSLGFELMDTRISQEDRERRRPAFVPPKL